MEREQRYCPRCGVPWGYYGQPRVVPGVQNVPDEFMRETADHCQGCFVDALGKRNSVRHAARDRLATAIVIGALALGLFGLCSSLSNSSTQVGTTAERAPINTSTAFASDCNARGEPSPDADLVGTVVVGRRYPVVDHRKGWTRVRLPNGTQGWVGCKTQ